MHLQVADQVIASPQLADSSRERLQQQLPAFYLGSVAPDFSAISTKVSRSQAHFYDTLPPGPDTKAHLKLWQDYPALAQANALPPDHANFLVAYVAHLMLDVIWFREILTPIFFEQPLWGSRAERFVSHNTLLVYLDGIARASLAENAGILLAQATPHNWLPFADDSELIEWRDQIVPQLTPNAPIRTVEVYAGRMKFDPDIYRANLNDPAWLDTNLFQKVPVAQVQARIQQAVSQTIDLIHDYFV
jgi:hypothetical protein